MCSTSPRHARGEAGRIALLLLLFEHLFVPSTPFAFPTASTVAPVAVTKCPRGLDCGTSRRHKAPSQSALASWPQGHSRVHGLTRARKTHAMQCASSAKDMEASSGSSFVSSINACAGDVDAAVAILESMRPEKHPQQYQHAIVAAVAVCGRGGAPGKARELFDKLASPDIKAYKALMQALALAGCGDEASHLIYECFEKQAQPDTECVNIVLEAYLRSARAGASPSSAGRLAHNLISRAPSALKIEADVTSFALAAETCMLAGDGGRARWLCLRAHRLYPDKHHELQQLELRYQSVCCSGSSCISQSGVSVALKRYTN